MPFNRRTAPAGTKKYIPQAGYIQRTGRLMPRPVVWRASAYSIGGTYHQFVAENSPCSEVGEQQAHERQCDGGPETLRMERKFGKNPPTEEIIGRFHNRRTDQQHDLHDTEPDLEQAAFEQEDRNERQHAGQCQHDAHVDGRLYSLSGRGLQGKGIEPELTRVAREPSQRGKERNGHERRDDEQMECLDSLYHNYLQSFINQILIPIRRPPVDELAQEPRQEQLHAEDHGEDRQVKERLIGDRAQRQPVHLFPDLCGNDPHRSPAADKEHQRPQTAEEIHRRAAEMRHEQHGDQIQVAFHGTFEAELRAAVFAGVVLDDLFADTAEPGLLRQNRNETVHLAVDLDRLDDLAAVGLQPAVEIVEFDAGDPARRPVEEFARPAFADRVAALLLPAGYQVVPFFEDHAAQFGNLVGRILQVGIHRDDDLAFGCGETAVQGCRLAVIAGEADAADRRGLLPERFDNLPGAV